MKTIATKLLLITLTVFLLTECKKVGTTYDAYFYTSIESSDSQLILELDDKTLGEIPLLKTTLSANNDTIINKALHLKLKTGKYKIVVRDKNDNLKCSGTLKFRFNKFNGATNQGVLEYAMTNNVIVTRIHF
jgi:hypothetical protein